MKIVAKKEYGPNEKASDQNIIDVLLKNRSITDIEEFLHPTSPTEMAVTDFGFKRDLARTLKLLEEIKTKGEMIVVYTDYDADGITGGTILWETLHLLGFKVMPYVPHRKHEGYGFSQKGIDRVKKEHNPRLIISVDHGISGTKEITYAKTLGIDIIVTDHHLKPETPPQDAVAIFHIPALSGSGVSYFFSKAVYEHFCTELAAKTDSRSKTNCHSLETYFACDYLALASIGTIADLVPLNGASRSIVYHGLKAFTHIKRSGITHIIKDAGITDKAITPYEIGFVIAPRINAVGRLEHAIDALRLLCTHNDEQAKDLASKVGGTNRDRQDLVAVAAKQAKGMVQEIIDKEGTLPHIITLRSNEWNEGIIGLIASKITEAHHRPTIVMTKSDGFWKGSARSVNKFHMTNFLRSLDKYLVSVGGHMLASGFTIKDEKMEGFLKQIEKDGKKLLKEEDLEKTIEVDIRLPLSSIRMSLAKRIETLAPFGMGNPHPSFQSNLLILDKKLFGKKSEHVKLMVKDAVSSSFPMEFVSFYKTEQYRGIEKGQIVSAIYNVDINRWNGRETLRGRINYMEMSALG